MASDGAREDILVYIGGMSKIRGTIALLQAATSAGFPQGWRLVLAGTAAPDVRAELESLLEHPSIEFRGQLTPDAARDLLLRAKVGIVPFQATRAHLESLPTKMFEYFAAGLPVILSDFEMWRSIVVVNDCGLVVDERSSNSIARAVATYAQDDALRQQHGDNARQLAVTKLNWASEGLQLVELYDALAGIPDQPDSFV